MSAPYFRLQDSPLLTPEKMLSSLQNAHGKPSCLGGIQIVTREKESISLYEMMDKVDRCVAARWQLKQTSLNASIQVIDKLRSCLEEAQNASGCCASLFLSCCSEIEKMEQLNDMKDKFTKTLNLNIRANEEREKFLQLPVTERRETLFPAASTGLDRDFTIDVAGRIEVIGDPIPQYYVPEPDDVGW